MFSGAGDSEQQQQQQQQWAGCTSSFEASEGPLSSSDNAGDCGEGHECTSEPPELEFDCAFSESSACSPRHLNYAEDLLTSSDPTSSTSAVSEASPCAERQQEGPGSSASSVVASFPPTPPVSTTGTASSSLTAAAGLSRHILEFAQSMKMTDGERACREAMKIIVQNAVKAKVHPDATVETVGSVASGTALPWTMMDLVCAHPNAISGIALVLQQLSCVGMQQVGSFMPDLHGCGVSVAVQRGPITARIHLCSPQEAAARRCFADLTLCWATKFPDALIPVTLVVKTMLRQANLADENGLSGYPVVLMVLEACRAVSERAPLAIEPGPVLLSFLSMFGKGCPPLPDPCDPTKDLLAGCTNIGQIQALFLNAGTNLATFITSGSDNKHPLNLVLDIPAAARSSQEAMCPENAPLGELAWNFARAGLHNDMARAMGSILPFGVGLTPGAAHHSTAQPLQKMRSPPPTAAHPTVDRVRGKQLVEDVKNRRFQGVIKSFVADTGFGFILSPEVKAMYGCDVFLHKQQFVGLAVGQNVEFSIYFNKRGKPQARDVVRVDSQVRHPMRMAALSGYGTAPWQTFGMAGSAPLSTSWC